MTTTLERLDILPRGAEISVKGFIRKVGSNGKPAGRCYVIDSIRTSKDFGIALEKGIKYFDWWVCFTLNSVEDYTFFKEVVITPDTKTVYNARSIVLYSPDGNGVMKKRYEGWMVIEPQFLLKSKI